MIFPGVGNEPHDKLAFRKPPVAWFVGGHFMSHSLPGKPAKQQRASLPVKKVAKGDVPSLKVTFLAFLSQFSLSNQQVFGHGLPKRHGTSTGSMFRLLMRKPNKAETVRLSRPSNMCNPLYLQVLMMANMERFDV